MKRSCLAMVLVLSLITVYPPLVDGQELTIVYHHSNRAGESRKLKQQTIDSSQTPTNSKQLPAPLDPHAEKIKRAVTRIGISGRITVYLIKAGELYGAVTQIDEDDFRVADVDLHQVVVVQYKNVKKVRSGYGRVNVFTGKRPNPPRGVKIAMIGGLIFLAFALPLILVATARD